MANWIDRFLAAIAIHKANASAHHTKYTLEEHGAAKHNNVTREIFLEASAGYISAGSTNSLEKGSCVAGGANVVEPDVYMSMDVPEDFVSFQKVEAIYSTDGGGNMYWRLLASWAAKGELRTTHSENTDLAQTYGLSSRILIEEHPDPLVLANLAVGDWLGIRFLRLGSDPLDTIDNTVRLAGLLFTYTANQ